MGIPSGLRVLHVAQPTEAGVAHVLLDEAVRQVEAGMDVHLACPDGELVSAAERAGIRRHRWSATRSPGPSTVSEVRALSDVVHRVDPDLVHLHSAKAGLVGRLAVRGRRPTVFMPHAWSWNGDEGAVGRLAEVWERRAARWAHVVVCVSDAEKRDGLTHHVAAPMRVLPNWVDVGALTVDLPDRREDARDALGVDRDVSLAVCVGRLAPQKGQDVLLAAWPSVRSRVPTARLVLVGDGPDREVLEARATVSEGVELVGARSRRECLLWARAADTVVCPSRYEGMALVPLEAAALGTVVVASDVEGMDVGAPPVVRDLVPVDDPRALADAVTARLEDRGATAAAGDAAATWSREHGSRAADAMLEVYEEALGARPVRRRSRRV